MKKLNFIVLLSLLGVSLSFAGSYVKTKYVKVVKHVKIYKTITREVPYQDCHYESVPVQHTRYVDEYKRNPAAPLLGGVIGGVIGHQFGAGKGKDLATAVGAIGGAMVANKNYGVKHYRRPVTTVTYEQRRVCNTYYRTVTKRVVRWKNIGYRHGKRIVKISKYRLKRIPIKIRVSY